MANNAQHLADLIKSHTPESIVQTLQIGSKSIPTFEADDVVMTGHTDPEPIKKLLLENPTGQALVPQLLRQGILGGDPTDFQTLLFRGKASEDVLDSWLQQRPDDVRYVDRDGKSLLSRATENTDSIAMRWALSRGIKHSDAHRHPIEYMMSYARQGLDDSVDRLLVPLVDYGMVKIIDRSEPGTTTSVDLTYGDASRRVSRNSVCFRRALHKLEQQSDKILQNIADAQDDEARGDVLQNITSQDLNRAYACNKLKLMCNPNLWSGHIERLATLSLDLSDAAAKELSQIASSAFSELQNAQGASAGTQVQSPFDLEGGINTAPEKGGSRDK